MESEADTSDLVALLRERGQRVTSQRLVILRELRSRARHLSAHEVHETVRHELPGTSVPTVYATLELLTELGLVRRLDLGLGTTLYDPRTAPHQHFVCRVCGEVIDVDGEVDLSGPLGRARRAGLRPDRAELVITGRCARCAS